MNESNSMKDELHIFIGGSMNGDRRYMTPYPFAQFPLPPKTANTYPKSVAPAPDERIEIETYKLVARGIYRLQDNHDK